MQNDSCMRIWDSFTQINQDFYQYEFCYIIPPKHIRNCLVKLSLEVSFYYITCTVNWIPKTDTNETLAIQCDWNGWGLKRL